MIRAILPSETHARKAQKILKQNGYFSEIIRVNQFRIGCGYALRIAGEPEEIQMLLLSANIPVRSLERERDSS